MKTWRTGDTARRAGAVLAVAGASLSFATAFAVATPQVASAATAAPQKGREGTIVVHGVGPRPSPQADPAANSAPHSDAGPPAGPAAGPPAAHPHGGPAARPPSGPAAGPPGAPPHGAGHEPPAEPRVCAFSLIAVDFTPGRRVAWEILSLPSHHDRGKGHDRRATGRDAAAQDTAAWDTLTPNENGTARTGRLRLRDGAYLLRWAYADEPGKSGRAPGKATHRQRAFHVDCTGVPDEDKDAGAAATAPKKRPVGDSAGEPAGAAPPAGPPAAAPPRHPEAATRPDRPPALDARTVATAGSTALGLLFALVLGIMFLRRHRGGSPAATAGGGDADTATTTLEILQIPPSPFPARGPHGLAARPPESPQPGH